MDDVQETTSRCNAPINVNKLAVRVGGGAARHGVEISHFPKICR